MKSIFPVALAVTMLASCTPENTQVVPELGGGVLTVDEYLAQPALREKVIAACRNDPGRLRFTPNCVNVYRADHLASVGTGSGVRIDLSP